MLVKVMSLAFNAVIEDFDDTELQDFLKQFSVFSIRDHFFMRGEVPYLAFIIKYLPRRTDIQVDAASQATSTWRDNKKSYDESWRQLLDESDMQFFNLLRKWRILRARKDGVAPYIILTNKQLALIIKAKPQSLADLEKIEGIGKGKLEKYGDEILAMTKVDSGPSTDGAAP